MTDPRNAHLGTNTDHATNTDPARNSNHSWICVADAERARLLEWRPTPRGTPHLEERAALETSWAEHERGRPAFRSGKSVHTHATPGHEAEEKVRHFARELAEWLDRKAAGREFARCRVYAPARFLGAFRKAVPPRLRGALELCEGELTRFTAGELARHPALLVLREGGEAARQ